MTDYAYQDIDPLLRRLDNWACIVGPQGAGKSTFSDYIRQHRAGQRHVWTSVPLMRAVMGDLMIRSIQETTRVPLLEATVGRPSRRRFDRTSVTKDLVLLEASISDSARHALPISFFDVPGEWAQRRRTRTGDPMHRLIRRTKTFLFFAPFWGLLPDTWLSDNALPVLGRGICSTSLTPGHEQHRQDFVAQAVNALRRDANEWFDVILEYAPRNIDILVILSQFQPSTVVPLFDAYASNLGTETCARYESANLRAAPKHASVSDLAQQLSRLKTIGCDLISALEHKARSEEEFDDFSLLARLTRLVHGGSTHQRSKLRPWRKVRSWSILPINVLSISEANADQWYARSSGDGLEEFRMCEDVIWWLLLHQKASILWKA